jgi:radical SAM superfamily enzyme
MRKQIFESDDNILECYYDERLKRYCVQFNAHLRTYATLQTMEKKRNNLVDKYALVERPIDLFEHPDSLPVAVQEVLNKHCDANSYEACTDMLNELKPLGYTFDFYLDAQPYNLQKILI